MVIVIIVNILLAYLGNSNNSSCRFGMPLIQQIRCYDDLEVMNKADVENNVKISSWWWGSDDYKEPKRRESY